MPEQHTQTITCCAAGRGWLWWVEAFRLVKDAVGPWFLIGLGYSCFIYVPTYLIAMATENYTWSEYVALLPSILEPCFIVGIVAAAWSQTRGEMPRFSHLFSGFKADIKTLLGIGVVTAAIIALLYLLIFFMESGGGLAKFTMYVFCCPLVFLVGMVAYLAPMVVVFQRAGIVGAMWSSLKALLANWRALTVYMLLPFTIILFFLVVYEAAVAVIAAFGGEVDWAAVRLVMGLLLLPFMPFLVSVGMLSVFVAYCDIFHVEDRMFPRKLKEAALQARS
jgi:hypothetical protein